MPALQILRPITGGDVQPGTASAHASRMGEDNSRHVVVAIVAVAAVGVIAGLINVRVGRSKG